jgi:hypothetical protein
VKKIYKTSNKKVRNATREVVDDIQFRSRLEAFTYRSLLEASIHNFSYEKHTFILVDKFEARSTCYEGDNKTGLKEVSNKIRPMTYTPDFCYIDENKVGWIIDVKGFANDVFPYKWKLFKKHLDDNNYNVNLFLLSTQKLVKEAIELIKSRYYEVLDKE